VDQISKGAKRTALVGAECFAPHGPMLWEIRGWAVQHENVYLRFFLLA
jgi:hypothetical protein